MGNMVIKRQTKCPTVVKLPVQAPAYTKPIVFSKVPTVFPRHQCSLRMLRLRRVHDHLLIQEDYIRKRKETGKYSEKEIEEHRTVDALRGGSPIITATLCELFNNGNNAIIDISNSYTLWYVPVLSIVDQKKLSVNCTVLVRLSKIYTSPSAVVGVLSDQLDGDIRLKQLKLDNAPNESFADIGGLTQQIQELKEAVEWPLTHPELYYDMGIQPPKGVILYGKPGTGKTLLAKAVANNTKATFLRITGSALIKKTAGEGPELVRNIFRTARENAPCILFIDEVDAVGSKRFDTSSGGAKEVQNTMLELLNQLDGFDSNTEVKVIMATNRIDVLDPALIRSGRIDRKIEVPRPDLSTKLKIFQLHTSAMTLSEDVSLSKLLARHNDFSGADIKSVCTEAGLCALREHRKMVKLADFDKALMQMKNLSDKETYYL